MWVTFVKEQVYEIYVEGFIHRKSNIHFLRNPTKEIGFYFRYFEQYSYFSKFMYK